MTAARKPNDMMAVAMVSLTVSSIGSSPFRLEGGPFRNRATLLTPLGQCQDVFLLRCTMVQPPQAEQNNARRAIRFGLRRNFFARSPAPERLPNQPLLASQSGRDRVGPLQKLWKIWAPKAPASADRVQRGLGDHGAVERLLQRVDQLVLVVGLDVETIVLVGDAHQVHDAVLTRP